MRCKVFRSTMGFRYLYHRYRGRLTYPYFYSTDKWISTDNESVRIVNYVRGVSLTVLVRIPGLQFTCVQVKFCIQWIRIKRSESFYCQLVYKWWKKLSFIVLKCGKDHLTSIISKPSLQYERLSVRLLQT